MYTGAPAGGGFSQLAGLVLAGGAVYLLFMFAVFFIGCYITYRIIRTAVRDGIVDAHKKTGGSIGGGGSRLITGYPPAQNYGAPVAPTAEQHSQYPGYGDSSVVRNR